jgi:crotonobetainyl-CoA:carnitine CoA-transferase CaiB-like acyl-CoA transferase
MGPLSNLVVVDASWGMPGSVGSMLLADYGAQVIKVERAGSPLEDVALTRQAWDRGKQSIVLDAREPTDRGELRSLVKRADIFIESFGLGRADAMGLGYDTFVEECPHLIYGSLTAYGREGPLKDEPGYMHLVAARMGIMAEQANHGREGPTFLGHPHIGYGTGFILAISLLAAVRARRSTGTGQRVDVSLLDGLLAQSPMNHWHQKDGLNYVERTGAKRSGFGRKRLITSAFECGDGEFIQIHTGGQGGFKKTMEIFGFGDITQDVVGASEMSVPLNDEEMVIARDYIPEAFSQRPRDEWVEMFLAEDIASVPVLRPGQVLADKQVKHANMAMTLDHPVHGEILQAAPPLSFKGVDLPWPTPAPKRDQHRESVKALISKVRAQPDFGKLTSIDHPLEGIRVLDFASFFATPYGAKILSDLGADVIQIEPPHGDQMRPLPNPFEAAQRGKRNLCINLKTEEGRKIVHELVKSADVVMHNQRPGKAEKIGIGFDELSTINPNLVYCYLPGYGSSGPRSHQKSFAPLQSGFTGLLYEAAGKDRRPVATVEGNEDYYNGLLGATSALIGLERRAATGGEAQYIESPQLHSSLFVTSHLFLKSSGESLPAMQIDHDQMGWDPLNRLYETADDWICLGCVGEGAWERLSSLMGIEADAREHPESLIATLSDKLALLTSEQAFTQLRANGIACEIPAKEPMVQTLFFEDWALEQDLVICHDDSIHGPIREIGHYMHFSKTPAAKKGPAPRLGQHTAEILTEMGFSSSEIDSLSANGSIVLDSA